ncbi:hypothetical protein D1872_226100 [compost metagenome]
MGNRLILHIRPADSIGQIHVPDRSGPRILRTEGDRRYIVLVQRPDDVFEFFIGLRRLKAVPRENLLVVIDRHDVQLYGKRVGLAVHSVSLGRSGYELVLQLVLKQIVQRGKQPSFYVGLQESRGPGKTDVRQAVRSG